MCLPVDRVDKKELNEQKSRNYTLKRSVSGYHADTEINCHCLPPIDLNIVLPASYPSNKAPIFSLHSIWLNRNQLSKICAELDNVAMANREMPVIFTWIDFLQTNALSLLGLDEEDLAITPMDIDDDESFDNRAHSEYDDFQRCIYEIIRLFWVRF
jgi:E3 ubiquitin-protein ligase RNF14